MNPDQSTRIYENGALIGAAALVGDLKKAARAFGLAVHKNGEYE